MVFFNYVLGNISFDEASEVFDSLSSNEREREFNTFMDQMTKMIINTENLFRSEINLSRISETYIYLRNVGFIREYLCIPIDTSGYVNYIFPEKGIDSIEDIEVAKSMYINSEILKEVTKIFEQSDWKQNRILTNEYLRKVLSVKFIREFIDENTIKEDEKLFGKFDFTLDQMEGSMGDYIRRYSDDSTWVEPPSSIYEAMRIREEERARREKSNTKK